MANLQADDSAYQEDLEPFPFPSDVLAQEYATELLEAGGWVFSHGVNGLAFRDREREHARHSALGGFEAARELRLRPGGRARGLRHR